MSETMDGTGYFAFLSPTALVHYQRTSVGDSGQAPHLTLQAITGGAVSRGRLLRAPTRDGREALGQAVAEEWIPPTGDVSTHGPESLKSEFRAIFPDGVIVDLETTEGRRDMRSLDRGLLARVLPTAVRCLGEGAHVVRLSGRWITPIFHRGRMRLIFVLPPDLAPDQFQTWLQDVRAWQVGAPATEGLSHARSD